MGTFYAHSQLQGERETAASCLLKTPVSGLQKYSTLREGSGAAGPRDWEMIQELRPRKTFGMLRWCAQRVRPHHPKMERDSLQVPQPFIRRAQTQAPTRSSSHVQWGGAQGHHSKNSARVSPGVSFPRSFWCKQRAN